MKELVLPSLVMLLACCCSKPKPKSIDSYFELFHKNGYMEETSVSKFQFDTTEAIVLTGIATNYEQLDSNTVRIVPGGANDDLKFTLRNLSFNETINFHYFGIREWVTLPQGNNAINIKLAPETRAEVFSFNLRDVLKKGFSRSNPDNPDGEFVVEHFKLSTGLYEFTWSVGLGNVSKPLFFEIR